MRARQHPFFGELITVEELARRLGVHRRIIDRWRLRHQSPDGTLPPLEAFDGWWRRRREEGVAGVKTRTPERFPVDGELLTFRDVALREGVTVQAIWGWRNKNKGPDGQLHTLQAYVDMHRLKRRQAPRRMVNGQEMTIYEAAERLGVSFHTIQNWLTGHFRPDGSRATLQDYWDFRMEVRAGRRQERGPRPARKHPVHGEMITIPAAARRLGVRTETLREHMWRRQCSLEESVEFYEARERRARDRAVDEIMQILGF